MAPPPSTSPFTRGLASFLGSRTFLAVALVAVAAVAGLSWSGLLGEGVAAAALAGVVAVGLALAMTGPALPGTVDPVTRVVTILLAVATGLLCAVAAISSVVPGRALAHGEVSRAGDRLELPPGAVAPGGRLRLLVHAPLPAGGTPVVEFRFAGGAAPLSGQVERTVSYARVGRGSRAAVAHDHNEVWVHGVLGSATALTLDRIDGPLAGPLQVSVHEEWIPPLVLWLVSLALLLLAAIWEARLGGGHLAPLAGMALGYGLLVHGNATPASAVGTSVGAILLGALAGALSGGLLAMLARLGPWARVAAPAPAPGKRAKPKA